MDDVRVCRLMLLLLRLSDSGPDHVSMSRLMSLLGVGGSRACRMLAMAAR